MSITAISGQPNAEDGAFNGLKVIAITRVIAAPFAAYQFALHGADVINVEHPDEGDHFRYVGDVDTSLPSHGMAAGFLAHGANKRSLTLNISKPQGQELLRRLVSGADVLIENLRTGTMSRYGLGYPELSIVNPRLIYCSITGYGQTGPKKSDAAIDVAIQAASGMMSITGTTESGPMKCGSTVVDYGTGYAAALAIATALYRRERTGLGQHIDVSMLETAMTMMSADVTRALTTGITQAPTGNRNSQNAYVHASFRCRSGTLVIAASTARQRERLWRTIERPDIPHDPRFSTPKDSRKNLNALYEEIEKTLKSKSSFEWEELMNTQGIAAMAVRTITEAVAHPQIVNRELFHRFERSDDLGMSITVPLTAYRLSRNKTRVYAPPPRLGQHTIEILRELGLSKSEIEVLQRESVV